MNRLIAGCLVLVVAACSGNGSTTGGGSGGSGGGSSAGGGTGGGSSAGGGTGGGSATGGGTGGGTVDAGSPNGPALLSLSAGESFTCAVLADKTAKCWGRGGAGQLGNGTNMTESVKPVAVMGITTAKQISAGYEHACAALDDGTVRCWGENGSGQLGTNNMMDSNVPVQPMGLSNVASVHAGVYTTCALTTGNQVYCWGRGGDVGDGTIMASLVPKLIPGLADVKQLSVSPYSGTPSPIHVCGVRTGGGAFCWGNNSDGQLGDGTQNGARGPVVVLNETDGGMTDALEITAGGSHACARRTSGLFCWGFSARTGDGTVERRLHAVKVDTTDAVDQIEAGGDMTLARTTDGGMICWGRQGRGQCGDSKPFVVGMDTLLSPAKSTLGNVSFFSTGSFHTCAYQASTTVTWCWGANDYKEIGYDFSGTRTSVPDYVRW